MSWRSEGVQMPGTFEDYFVNPYDSNKNLNVSIVFEHRFAFYYWMKWTTLQAKNHPPVLILLDWHQDLVWPIFLRNGCCCHGVGRRFSEKIDPRNNRYHQ